jgi:competence protein ComEC
LFDTGTAGMTQQVVLPAVQTIGQVQLDRVMISHADQDHAGGVAILQQATAVGRWQLGQPLPELPNSQPCVSGQTWLWDGVRFEVLAPFATGWSDLPDNEQSCVLRISTPPDANGQVSRVLIMGDAGHLTEQVLLLMCADLRADVLVVGHHGSKTSSSAHFIAAVQPVRAVIAAGYANRFGHPHRVVIDTLQQAGVQIDSTIDSGTLTYTLGQGVLAPPVEQRSRWPWLSWPN